MVQTRRPLDEREEGAACMNVKGIGGVAIYAQDPAGLASWYAQHLGIESLEEKRGNGRSWDFYFRDVDDPELRRRMVWSLLRASDLQAAGARAFVVNYLVENLDEAVERLRVAGIEVEWVEEHADGRFARLADPEGNTIELWED